MSGSGGSRAAFLLAAALFVSGAAMLGYSFLGGARLALVAIAPARARAGDTLVLRGSGFSIVPDKNTVLFGDRTARVLKAVETQLEIEVPELANAEGQATVVPVRVIVGEAASLPASIEFIGVVPAPPAAAVEAPPVETAEAVVPAETAPPAVAPVSTAPPARPRLPKAAPLPSTQPPAVAAVEAPAPPIPNPPAAQRRFVLERTAVESTKRVTADLEGFDTAGVNVKRAPDVLGRVDFAVTPAQVRPGDRFTVEIYLINDGQKDIKLKDMFVATSVNGRLVSGPTSLKTRDVGPKRKAVIGSFSDTWREATASWAMDVTATSDRGDVYKNQIVWK